MRDESELTVNDVKPSIDVNSDNIQFTTNVNSDFRDVQYTTYVYHVYDLALCHSFAPFSCICLFETSSWSAMSCITCLKPCNYYVNFIQSRLAFSIVYWK